MGQLPKQFQFIFLTVLFTSDICRVPFTLFDGNLIRSDFIKFQDIDENVGKDDMSCRNIDTCLMILY